MINARRLSGISPHSDPYYVCVGAWLNGIPEQQMILLL